MGKELCFIIENENIYLEQVLVNYIDIPIFFLCRGKKQYYIALCTDISKLIYIITKLSFSDAYCLLHGKMPMRDAILKQKEYWLVYSENEISSDIVTKHEMSMLKCELLPEDGAVFQILTKQVETFVQEFEKEFFATKYFTESEKKADLNDLDEVAED